MDLRYVGQNYEIELPWARDPAGLRAAFEARHRQLYGYATGEGVECVNVRVVARLGAGVTPHPGPLPKGERETSRPLPRGERGAGEAAASIAGSQRAYFPATGEVALPRFDRATLPPGLVVRGPAMIEDEWSTIIVYPGQRAAADERGHVIVNVEPAP
jgi:N-methylhydantoinase A